MIDAARIGSESVSFVRPDGTFLYEMVQGDDGILRCRTAGLWSRQEADGYLAHLGRLVARARAVTGLARVLIDIRDASVQSADVTMPLLSSDATMRAPRDWRAFVVESRLKMMQLRRGVLFAGTQVFASPTDAERWLYDRR